METRDRGSSYRHARVVDGRTGAPLAGVPVRLDVLAGNAQLDAGVAESGPDGLLEFPLRYPRPGNSVVALCPSRKPNQSRS